MRLAAAPSGVMWQRTGVKSAGTTYLSVFLQRTGREGTDVFRDVRTDLDPAPRRLAPRPHPTRPQARLLHADVAERTTACRQFTNRNGLALMGVAGQVVGLVVVVVKMGVLF
ncbi:hypothetical protein, partial [Streptomyces flaveolus]|uniref:hypothetical protein n=1 Tax=Streptomyces flaveolus TaxID=67297 RepID=UPI0033DD9E8C